MSEQRYQRFSERFFQVSPLYTQPGWYIRLREGKTLGPFPTKAAAQIALFNLFGIVELNECAQLDAQEDMQFYSHDSRR